MICPVCGLRHTPAYTGGEARCCHCGGTVATCCCRTVIAVPVPSPPRQPINVGGPGSIERWIRRAWQRVARLC